MNILYTLTLSILSSVKELTLRLMTPGGTGGGEDGEDVEDGEGFWRGEAKTSSSKLSSKVKVLIAVKLCTHIPTRPRRTKCHPTFCNGPHHGGAILGRFGLMNSRSYNQHILFSVLS